MIATVVQMTPHWFETHRAKQLAFNLAEESIQELTLDLNLSLLAEQARVAAQASDILVFPELVTCGYSFMSPLEAAPMCLTQDSPVWEPLQAIANILSCVIVVGFAERRGTKLHNSQIALRPNQAPVCYAKVNLWGNDFLWAEPGSSSPPVFEFKGKKIGLLICRDVRDSSNRLGDFYEPGDADIVCFSSNWGAGGFPAVSWVDFAKNNQAWLAVSNRGGVERSNDFGIGGSCIVSPTGEVRAPSWKEMQLATYTVRVTL